MGSTCLFSLRQPRVPGRNSDPPQTALPSSSRLPHVDIVVRTTVHYTSKCENPAQQKGKNGGIVGLRREQWCDHTCMARKRACKLVGVQNRETRCKCRVVTRHAETRVLSGARSRLPPGTSASLRLACGIHAFGVVASSAGHVRCRWSRHALVSYRVLPFRPVPGNPTPRGWDARRLCQTSRCGPCRADLSRSESSPAHP